MIRINIELQICVCENLSLNIMDTWTRTLWVNTDFVLLLKGNHRLWVNVTKMETHFNDVFFYILQNVSYIGH